MSRNVPAFIKNNSYATYEIIKPPQPLPQPQTPQPQTPQPHARQQTPQLQQQDPQPQQYKRFSTPNNYNEYDEENEEEYEEEPPRKVGELLREKIINERRKERPNNIKPKIKTLPRTTKQLDIYKYIRNK